MTAQTQPLTLRFVPDVQSWAVFDGETRLHGWYATRANAANARKRDERQRNTRPCLCCGTVFPSEGPHHRLCNRCRHQTEGMI